MASQTEGEVSSAKKRRTSEAGDTPRSKVEDASPDDESVSEYEEDDDDEGSSDDAAIGVVRRPPRNKHSRAEAGGAKKDEKATTLKKHWSKHQVDILQKVEDIGKEGDWKLHTRAEKYNAVCKVFEWPVRDGEAYRHKLKRMKGTAPVARWTNEQLHFLLDAKQRKVPNATVYKDYQAKVESDNWSKRSYKTVMERLSRITVHDIEPQDPASNTASDVLTPTRRAAWTPEEDELLRSEMKKGNGGVADLWEKLKKLPAEQKTMGPDRTITAVTRRMYLLRVGAAKSRPRRRWTDADDGIVLSTARKTKKGKLRAIAGLAARLCASEGFVKLRWNALCGKAGVAEPEMSENDDEPRQDEESSLQREPPTSWIDDEGMEGLAPVAAVMPASSEEEEDDVSVPQPISPGPQEWGTSATQVTISAYQSEIVPTTQEDQEDAESVGLEILEEVTAKVDVGDSVATPPSVHLQGVTTEFQYTVQEEMYPGSTGEMFVEDVEMGVPTREAPAEDSSHVPVEQEVAAEVTAVVSAKVSIGAGQSPHGAEDEAAKYPESVEVLRLTDEEAQAKEAVDVSIGSVPAGEEMGPSAEEMGLATPTIDVTSVSVLDAAEPRGEAGDVESEEGEGKEQESSEVFSVQPSADVTTTFAGLVSGDPSEVTGLVVQQSVTNLPPTSQAEPHAYVPSVDKANDDED